MMMSFSPVAIAIVCEIIARDGILRRHVVGEMHYKAQVEL
jgi:hypothetical protein